MIAHPFLQFRLALHHSELSHIAFLSRLMQSIACLASTGANSLFGHLGNQLGIEYAPA